MKANLFIYKYKIILFALLLLLTACHSKNSDYEDNTMSDVESELEVELYKTDNSIAKTTIPKSEYDLEIIKTASTRYKVTDVNKFTARIKENAKTYGAYVSHLELTNNSYKTENQFTLKVPNQYFEELMTDLKKGVESVEYESITTRDVTEEYMDINTRLNTKLEVKSRYEEVLRKNAKTVEDILATEDKLRVLQEEIEAAQGRLNYLSNRVAYSTINIELYEIIEDPKVEKEYGTAFGDRVTTGLNFGLGFIENLVVGLIHIWPFVIGAVLAFAFWKRKKLRNN